MGLTSALSVGRSALAAYQAALQIAGNNIANAATPGYTRTSAQLGSIAGARLVEGQLGLGVRVDGVRRNVSEALHARLRLSLSERQGATAERASMSRIESVYDTLGDQHLGTLMGAFFKAVGNLQNNPENVANRGIVVTNGQALARRIREIRTDLNDHAQELNEEIIGAAAQADQLAGQVADLNTRISIAEAGGTGLASALRDQRDRVLSDLSELMAVSIREQPGGAVNVYVGNEALVQFGHSAGLKAAMEADSAGRLVAVVRFKENNGQVDALSGQVAGLIASRDTHIIDQLNRLDTLAAGLISEFNRIHAGGQGLQGFSSLSGATAATDPSLSLSSTTNGIAFPPKTGSFYIDVKDMTTGTVVRHQINIDLDGIGTDSSLASVAADISANVPGVTATVLPDGRLQLSAAAGRTFTFADDTSGFLAAAGLNTFFSGASSADIDVSSLIASSPALLAAARSGLSGDGSNATALAALQNQAVAGLGGISLNDYYTATASDIAVRSSSAESALQSSSIVFDSLTAQREGISGVNMDEEATNLISYQRAYEGSARYMGVVNDMLQTLLGLLR